MTIVSHARGLAGPCAAHGQIVMLLMQTLQHGHILEHLEPPRRADAINALQEELKKDDTVLPSFGDVLLRARALLCRRICLNLSLAFSVTSGARRELWIQGCMRSILSFAPCTMLFISPLLCSARQCKHFCDVFDAVLMSRIIAPLGLGPQLFGGLRPQILPALE